MRRRDMICRMIYRSGAIVLLFAMAAPLCRAQNAAATRPTTGPATRPMSISSIAGWDDARLNTDRGRLIVANILTWQQPNGGWWKNYSALTPRPATMPASTLPAFVPAFDRDEVWHEVSTIDNGATYSEIRILSHANRLWPKPQYRDSITRGVGYLLSMQYPNGGFPQRFPLQDNYGRHITFNDDAMTNVMRLLRDVADGAAEFSFVDQPTRRRCADAFDRGVECTLNCQIKVNGKLTAWCAQHDEVTFAPTNARAYELPSISGDESVGITLLLMDIKNPSDRVKQAVRASVEWFDLAKILGKRVTLVQDPSVPGGRDRRVVDDPNAPPLWGRFYDLETNRPFFCGRDGIKKWSMAEIEPERRNGYQWLRPWGAPLLERYPAWAAANQMPPLPTTQPSP